MTRPSRPRGRRMAQRDARRYDQGIEEVVRMALVDLEIRKRGPFADGTTFGSGGVYERIDGIAHFAVDPTHPANQDIIDLDKAARDDSGRVRFLADFCIL